MAKETVTDEIMEDEANDAAAPEEIVEDVVISKDDYKKLKASNSTAGGGWKYSVARYVMDNQGCSDIEAYDGSGGRKTNTAGKPVTEKQKVNNIASAYTHLRDAGYMIKKEDSKIYCLTQPRGKDIILCKDQKDRYTRLMG